MYDFGEHHAPVLLILTHVLTFRAVRFEEYYTSGRGGAPC